MLPFDTVAPSTPLFGVPRNMKEMKMCRWAVCSINCIRTSESDTLLPFSFSRSSRATLSAVSAVHSLVKASKTTLKHQNSLKSLFELQRESTSASLSCLRGYYSNMAPRTVKRAISPFATLCLKRGTIKVKRNVSLFFVSSFIYNYVFALFFLFLSLGVILKP